MDPIYETYLAEVNKTDVYRIEHKVQKRGPYFADYSEKDIFAKKFPLHAKYNPDPTQDTSLMKIAHDMGTNLNKLINNAAFGFSSIQDMKRWFSSNGIRFLLNTGEFRIIKKSIPGDKVINGEYQCVVNKSIWSKTPSKTVKFS